MADETFNALSGTIKTKDGLATLKRGDSIPTNADPEDVNRLRGIGHIGVESSPPAPQADVPDPFTGDEARLEEWVSDSTVAEVLTQASDSNRAEQLLEIEEAREKPRKGVIDGLTLVINGEPSDEQLAETATEPPVPAEA